MFYFFLPNFFDNLRRLFISTKRAFDQTIIFHLMFSPLCKAFQVKGVQANSGTSGGCITFNNLHVADGAKIILIIFFLFFNNDLISRNVDLNIF